MQRKKVGEKGKATPPCYLPEKMRILVLYTYETRIYMYAYVYTCTCMYINIISVSHTFFVHELFGLCSTLALYQEDHYSISCYMYISVYTCTNKYDF